MTQPAQTVVFGRERSNRAVDLHVIPDPRWSTSQFCAMAARALRCRRCMISLTGSDGEILLEDATGQTVHFLGNQDAPLGPGSATLTDTLISFPLTLPDGTTGRISAVEREDGTPFTHADLQLLEHLTAFYSASLATPARRDMLRLRNELRAVRKHAILTEERERQRLSREMHDDLGHVLTTAILSVDMKAQQIQDEVDAREAMAAARQALVDCSDRLHEFAFYLRPAILQDLGLPAALRSLARRASSAGSASVTVTVHGPERRYRDDIELAAFRIMQEALTNSLKHAHATKIVIEVTSTDTGLEVELRDNGIGFTTQISERAGGRYGQGLAGMQERAELVGGVLEIQSKVGSGTSVWVQFPLVSGQGGKA
ncbi:MAG TPA: sensor histidine kinase [Thermomicrobiales bacterium]|jgi:two-component system sensor histidine kinase UhpB|nr:sensor histidine kinase [Thermomicrobiales bacterium]